MDVHRKIEGLNPETAAQAHKRDLEVQDKYGVNYMHYWFSEKDGTVFCLSEAPNAEAAAAVHKEAHGMLPDEIHEVKSD
ncbi:gualylate cyclase [Alkalilimnicola ehrlichii]|uniref:Gualylate cyclase n=2 Tax=Alkalilimnicola ehrlichii TaxID=351052 RepID=A0A3E0WI99_9GAMM|nr:gualylate cyclase [Alkalilimnicola ehrlichii]RFA31943.1 gualylate cyclase [Alkalilimnicola ehrlichii]